MRKLQIHPLGLAVILFGLLTWFVALGGVAGSAYHCQVLAEEAEAEAEAVTAAAAAAAAADAANAAANAAASNNTATPIPIAASAIAPPTKPQMKALATCAQSLQWEWFSLWFAFAFLLACAGTAFDAAAFRRGRAALLSFATLLTACLLLSAHNFITKVDISAAIDVRNGATDAAAVGFVLLSFATMTLMLLLAERDGHSGGGLGGHGSNPLAAYDTRLPPDYGAHVRYQANPPV
jgi:hypothetical protein